MDKTAAYKFYKYSSIASLAAIFGTFFLAFIIIMLFGPPLGEVNLGPYDGGSVNLFGFILLVVLPILAGFSAALKLYWASVLLSWIDIIVGVLFFVWILYFNFGFLLPF